MKAGTKFMLGASTIVAAVALLIGTGVKETGLYFLTPHELQTKQQTDPRIYDVGMKVGGKVLPGSIVRDNDARRIEFKVTDGQYTFPVTYTGLVPDTFTDANDIEVVVEGRMGRDGVFVATDVLAKCGSRYEAVPQA